MADDGTSVFRDDERLEYSHVVRCLHVGEKLDLTILREGKVCLLGRGGDWGVLGEEGDEMVANTNHLATIC